MGFHHVYDMHILFITEATQGPIEIVFGTFGYGFCLSFETLLSVRFYFVGEKCSLQSKTKGTELLLKIVTSDFLVYFADKSSTLTGVNLVSLRRLTETHISEHYPKQSNMGSYKLKRCSKKKCCKQCRHAKFKCAMTNRPVQKQTHRTKQNHAEYQDATDTQNKTFCVFRFFMSDMHTL